MGAKDEYSPLIIRRSARPEQGDFVPLEVPTNERRKAVWGHALNPFKTSSITVSFLLILLILTGTAQKVYFRLMLFPMEEYILLINQVQAFSFIPLFFLFAQFDKQYKHNGSWPENTGGGSLWPTVAIGALEMVNMLLQLFGGSHLGGALQVLLAQVRIPVTMILSKILLGAEYHIRQYVGVCVVFTGILIAVAGDVRGDATNSLGWCLVFISAALPSCLANVLRERVLSKHMDPFVLGYRVALFQFLLGLPLLVLFAPMSHLPLSHLPQNFYDGFRCWLFGENPEIVTEGAHDCANAPLSVWTFLLSNFGYNVVQLLVFKHASATIQIIATTMIIPLSGLAFSMPLVMGQYARPWKIREVIGAVLVAAGILIYKSVFRFGVQTLKFSFGMNSSEVGMPVQNIYPRSHPRHAAVQQFLSDSDSSETPSNLP